MSSERSNPFKDFVNNSPAMDKLSEPIRGTSLSTQIAMDFDLPEDTSDLVRKLVELQQNDPKKYQTYMMANDLQARLDNGSMLLDGQNPELWVDQAETLSTTHWKRSWYLRQAASEYIVQSAINGVDFDLHAEILLKGILGGDEELARTLTSRLISFSASYLNR